MKIYKKELEEMTLTAQQQWENLTLADDFLFGKIMSEPALCAEMLRRIFPEIDVGEINFYLHI